MHPSIPAPRCAPYRVFADDLLVGSANTLESLYHLLDATHDRLRAERERLTALRARRLEAGVYLRPVPELPQLCVLDARGTLREEFSSAWRLLWFFDCKAHGLRARTDHGWNGDWRPRGEPVPGTGRPHGRYGRNYYRRPGTQALRRQAYWIAEEGEPVPRGARGIRGLPTAWDDVPRRAWRERSWKRYRDTQYKG
jgi:hypothetical protein